MMGAISLHWRSAVGLGAAALVVWLLISLGGSSAAGAVVDDPDVDTSAAYEYRVDPEGGSIDVTIDLAVTADKPNRSAGGGAYYQYYLQGAVLAVPADVTGLTITDGSGRALAHEVDDGIDGVFVLEIDFRRNVFYRQTADVVVSFVLPGGEARSDSFTRINDAYAGFEVWTDPQLEEATVTVIAPPGFDDRSTGATPFDEVGSGDGTRLVATDVDPEFYWAAVSLARDGRLVTTELEVADHEVEIRSWPGDRQWVDHVTRTLEEGLPALIERIGLPWPIEDELAIIESYSPYLSGYAGWYDAATDEIEIGDELDAHLVFHELSHVWFNDDLFAQRWITEGLADEFGAAVVESMGEERPKPPRTSLVDGAARPLNRWSAWGADEEEESWSYGASWTVTDALVGEVGLDVVSAAVQAAAADEIAYLGDGDPEPGRKPSDWRLYLDLLENRSGIGSDDVSDLFVEWVLTEAEADTLEPRAGARTRYAGLEEAGGRWAPPLALRKAMADWEFEAAGELMGTAESLLDDRSVVMRVLDPLDAELPAELETSYEDAGADLAATEHLMTEVGQAADGLRATHDRIEAATGVLQRIGAIGADHRSDLEVAVGAFEGGELGQATRAAADIDAEVEGLTGDGLLRVGLVVAAVGVFIGGVLVLRRRRSRPSSDAVPAVPAPPPGESAQPADGDGNEGGDEDEENPRVGTSARDARRALSSDPRPEPPESARPPRSVR